MPPDHPDADRTSTVLAASRLGLLGLALVVVGVFTLWRGAGQAQAALDRVAGAGWAGVVLFIALYAVATVALVPGSASTATSGLVFGPVVGAGVALAGATLGAFGAYVIARGVGRRPVELLLRARAAQLDRWIDERQFRSIVVLRLLPVVPFNLLNYAAGLSPIRPRPFTVGTFLGVAPSAVLVAWVGSSARDPGGAAVRPVGGPAGGGHGPVGGGEPPPGRRPPARAARAPRAARAGAALLIVPPVARWVTDPGRTAPKGRAGRSGAVRDTPHGS